MLLVVAPAPGVRAQQVEVEGRAGAGYDGNPLFAASPGQRREDLEGEAPVDPDGVATVAADGAVRGGARLFGEANLHGDARVYFRGDVIALESLGVLGGLRTADQTLTLSLGLGGSRYDST